MRYGIGEPVPRSEDRRFLTGRGRYVDDLAQGRMAHGAVVRSPHAHARIAGIDASAALAAPGVLAVLTGADYRADGLGAMPCLSIDDAIVTEPARRAATPALAPDAARHVGAPVAFVVAETRERALDAAELVSVAYEALPAVADSRDAARGAAMRPEAPANFCFAVEMGNRAATEAAFAAAHLVVALDLYNNRIAAVPMEPRGAIGEYDAADGRYRLHLSCQNPHRVRQVLAQSVFRIPESRLSVVARDVGGGFGMKGGVFPEDALVLWAAHRLDRPVKWIAERGESMVSDAHARDQRATAEMALDGHGRILGLRVEADYNLGAHLAAGAGVSPVHSTTLYSGVYAIPAIWARTRAVYTNTAWTAPYRGAGRPEASYLLERLVERAARETGIDGVALRRRNFIAPEAMPYRTALALEYDSGAFEAVMDAALPLADWDGFAARRAGSGKRGLLRGRGVACYLESAALSNERMEIRFDASGSVTVVAGTFSHGQGHETVYAQMVADWLGVDFDAIRLVQGDTDAVSIGRGTFGSRSMTVGGSALRIAADRVIDRGKRIAAHLLEAPPEDIAFAKGRFSVAGTDRSVSIVEAAKASYAAYGFPAELGLGLDGIADYAAGPGNFPNGCQIAEVEVDPETGAVALARLSVVDDVGRVINPLLLAGQIHGGVAQGVGQALMEDIVYHRETGQLLTGSLMDYALPRADDLPCFALDTRAAPTSANPLGVKGAGESGTIGATPAVVHAVLDALAPLGIADIAIPATPERVWRAIRDAGPGLVNR
ncbi:MAG: xanthine dehydrogenase family protein molybdopterin-binding subunit [Defluviicoccus sp.]|nr:xanthine dehydrogenase family protein molybdopterin-binding subunit [Defluviicoccus sp.]